MTQRFAIFSPQHALYSRPPMFMDEEPPPAPAVRQLELPTVALLDVLLAVPRFGEAIGAAFRRKEDELVQLFSSLTPAQADALHRRLGAGSEDGELDRAFARLAEDRRDRLLGCLRHKKAGLR